MTKRDIYLKYLNHYNIEFDNNIIIVKDYQLKTFIEEIIEIFGNDFFIEFKKTTFKFIVNYKIKYAKTEIEEYFYVNYKGRIKNIVKKNFIKKSEDKIYINYDKNHIVSGYHHYNDNNLVFKCKFNWSRKKILNSVNCIYYDDYGKDYVKTRNFAHLDRKDKINLSYATRKRIRTGLLDYNFFR